MRGGDGADALHFGLFETPEGAKIESITDTIMEASDVHIEHYTRDGASANSRLIAARAGAARDCDYWFLSDKLCSLHQNKLVETSIVRAAGLDVLGEMFRAAKLLRMGGYLCLCLCPLFNAQWETQRRL